MTDQGRPGNFEQEILPHLDAAYNLARWLTRNEQDAQDAVQEAYLRAFRFFPGFRGGNARAWLMKIVRNACYTWLHVNRPLQEATEFDESYSPPDQRIFVKYSFFANSRGCPTERSQISPANLQVP
jgi:RNA polymerase sigma factor (sigma-70 family)